MRRLQETTRQLGRLWGGMSDRSHSVDLYLLSTDEAEERLENKAILVLVFIIVIVAFLPFAEPLLR